MNTKYKNIETETIQAAPFAFQKNAITPTPAFTPTTSRLPLCNNIIAILAIFTIFLTGCGKSYKTILGSDENVSKNSAVEIDGNRINAGRIKKIYVDASGKRVAEFSTGSESLKKGTVRVPRNDVIDLRAGRTTTDILPSGAMIPVESKIAYLTGKWSGKTLALIGMAVVVAALALQRFLAFRALQSVLPLIAAAGLAVTTSYCTHQFLIPIVQEFQSKIRTVKVSGLSEQTPAVTTSGSWADKIRGTEKEMTNFLRTPTDSARLLSFLVIFIVTLPVFACLISWTFRKLACQPIVCSILLLAAIPTVVSAAPGQTGVFYNREFLRDEQKLCQQHLSEVENTLSAASRLLDTKLPGVPERLVQSLFISDFVAIRLEGQLDRISQLKSSFGYVRSDEQRKLNAAYSELRQRLQTLQLETAKLCERSNEITNETTVLQIFQTKQADYRNLIRSGLSDVKIVLEQSNRQLAASLAARTETKLKDNEKSEAELARLQREQTESMQGELARLRLAQQNTNRPPPTTIIVTNEIRTVVEKLVPAPAPAPEIRFVTNTIVATVTNTNAAVTPQEISPDQAAQPETDSINIETAAGAEVRPASVPAFKTNQFLKLNKPAFYIGGLIVIVGFALVAWLMTTGRSRVLQIAQDGKTLAPFEIASADDVLVLESVPRIGHRSQVEGKPSIRPTWRGSVLDPGNESVTVNDSPIHKPKCLRPGDRFTAINGENKSCTFNFLGCDHIGETVEA